MKLKNDFTIREITGDYIVVPVGENYLDFGAVISLNETGAFLWGQLQNDCSAETLAKALADEYGIRLDEAVADTEEFIGLLKQHGLLSDE